MAKCAIFSLTNPFNGIFSDKKRNSFWILFNPQSSYLILIFLFLQKSQMMQTRKKLEKNLSKKRGTKVGCRQFRCVLFCFVFFTFLCLYFWYKLIITFNIFLFVLLDVLGNKGLKELAECFCFNGCVTFTENTIRENTA